MLIEIGYDIELALSAPTALIFLLRVHPSREHDLQAPESLGVHPFLPTTQYIDAYGNRCGRIQVPAGVSTVRLSNHARIYDSGLADPVYADAYQHAPQELPTEVLHYLLPSRYCEVDSELLPFAWAQFGHAPLGWARVQAVCSYVHQRIRFDYAQARANRSALQGFHEQTGVCRDFAHLAITLCRCLNIPARYCTGYLGDIGIPPVPSPMDFSAWFEVYLGGQWVTFDARHNKPRIGRVLMAQGRDAGDVPITMTFGPNTLNRFAVVTDQVH
ncbi:Putative TGc (Transglutaminase/protease-like) domain containing protein [Rubrivivax sp. A210]|uniref:transglutaminase-like domain-containing protein n=1 Tax=Rubrivivax sp. A210 TaxID=2772301 RepID=UPI00191A6E5B|nr:transglutaminase family protein [Rubrivivax sp. A210]CAD5374952.1 Putative TGc (Transglutaminase/protease-like) domain containing protein [Rubrivivax sp. A210]